MGDCPKFTIVTPSLNQRVYIEQTIRSVIEQEGAFEIEYFIMDGGSTDGSVELIRQYADEVNQGHHPIRCARVRIHWKSERDPGQSNAINTGLRQASGEFAAYINSDDVYMPRAFSSAGAGCWR
jgi:glycosyltransferase involved in cell wall biosynthesis